jgi:hypothetical protein
MTRLFLLLVLAACTEKTEDTELASLADGGADSSADTPVVCTVYPFKKAWFGDLHAHTSFSLDAWSFATRNEPLDAYHFARGKMLQIASGMPAGEGGPDASIHDKLDFLAITDHSEWLSATMGCVYDPNSTYYDNPWCADMRSPDPNAWSTVWSDKDGVMASLCNKGSETSDPSCNAEFDSAWTRIQKAAEAANDRCNFTTFIGFEWTHGDSSKTLHKNVIFANTTVPALPLDNKDYPTQEALWHGLDNQCDAGCEALTIPHNSNLSEGQAFQIDAGSEAAAAKYQRLVEVMQHKGSSECYFGFTDLGADRDGGINENCDFEYAGTRAGNENSPLSYIRWGLGKGMVTQQQSGTVNPLQLGFIASTDDHNGTPGNTYETTWPGHEGRFDDTPESRLTPANDGEQFYKNPGGLAVAWAEENTRESLFAAFKRRETYATSGTRIQVRFYQTWDQSTDFCADSNFPQQIVGENGVPMGGTFGTFPVSGKPRFFVQAWKDRTDLQRVDVIRISVDASNNTHHALWSQNLPGGGGCVTFTDSSYDPTQPTLYYARVMEMPSPRWSKQDCGRA